MGLNIQYDDLGQVASATGGFLMKNQNDLLWALGRIDRDLREFYTLVYQPTNKTYDGSFRKIKVELLKPGYHVRHRQGYWAIPPGQEMMMTPAAAQLLAGIAAGNLNLLSRHGQRGDTAGSGRQAGRAGARERPAKALKFEKDPNKDLYSPGLPPGGGARFQREADHRASALYEPGVQQETARGLPEATVPSTSPRAWPCRSSNPQRCRQSCSSPGARWPSASRRFRWPMGMPRGRA